MGRIPSNPFFLPPDTDHKVSKEKPPMKRYRLVVQTEIFFEASSDEEAMAITREYTDCEEMSGRYSQKPDVLTLYCQDWKEISELHSSSC